MANPNPQSAALPLSRAQAGADLTTSREFQSRRFMIQERLRYMNHMRDMRIAPNLSIKPNFSFDARSVLDDKPVSEDICWRKFHSKIQRHLSIRRNAEQLRLEEAEEPQLGAIVIRNPAPSAMRSAAAQESVLDSILGVSMLGSLPVELLYEIMIQVVLDDLSRCGCIVRMPIRRSWEAILEGRGGSNSRPYPGGNEGRVSSLELCHVNRFFYMGMKEVWSEVRQWSREWQDQEQMAYGSGAEELWDWDLWRERASSEHARARMRWFHWG